MKLNFWSKKSSKNLLNSEITILDINDTTQIKTNITLDSIFLLDTDTIIGLSCSAFSDDAIKRLSIIKNRDIKKNYIQLINSIEIVASYCDLTSWQKSILKNNWPNPITFILKNKMTQEKMLFRWPKDIEIEKLIKTIGPLITTSANISKQTSAKDLQTVSTAIKKHINFYIKKTTMNKNIASTVIDLTENKVIVVRQGIYFLRQKE